MRPTVPPMAFILSYIMCSGTAPERLASVGEDVHEGVGDEVRVVSKAIHLPPIEVISSLL